MASAETADGGEGDREGRRRRRRGGRGRGARAEGEFEPTFMLDEAAAERGTADTTVRDASAPAGRDEAGTRTRERPRRERDEEPGSTTASTTAVERTRPAASTTAVASTPAPAPRVMPSLPAFDLPLTDLQALADGAGLQWVHSDADKVRVVQEAIAATPRPIHVPRERKPVVQVDDGPLVLVETRKDLSQLKLPFELMAEQQQQQ